MTIPSHLGQALLAIGQSSAAIRSLSPETTEQLLKFRLLFKNPSDGTLGLTGYGEVACERIRAGLDMPALT